VHGKHIAHLLSLRCHVPHRNLCLPVLGQRVTRFWYTELGDDHIAVTGDSRWSRSISRTLLYAEMVLLKCPDQCLNRKDAIEGDENDRYQGNHPVQT
jgi:hypothetical protein